MGNRTRVDLGRGEDLGADCANCFGLCCVALAFVRSSDFPLDKPAGEPCTNLDAEDACRIHPHLHDRGFKGCVSFDCFGAGQKVSQRTFDGRSWRDDPETRTAMFAAFPIVRSLHELLRYLDEAIALVDQTRDPSRWVAAFERVRHLSDRSAVQLATLDIDAEHNAVRTLLIEASEIARTGIERTTSGRLGASLRPGSDLMGATMAGTDLSGISLRGSIAIGADLSGARFARCDVLGVDMRDAKIADADLESAIYLTQMQVNSARGNGQTVLPRRCERPAHWPDQ